MTRASIAGGLAATGLVLVALAAGYRALDREAGTAAPASPAPTPATAPAAEADPAPETYQGFLYGRVTTVDGVLYEGRLRWGGDQEAFWSDSFNGSKRDNPWLAHVPPERLREEGPSFEIFGMAFGRRQRPLDLRRQLMVPFGEIVRLEASGREVRVTLKSGAAFDLDRLEASDFDDGLRVWDGRHGVVDLDSLRIRAVELLPTPPLGGVPVRLHGTVRTGQGDFTGFVQWDREECLGTDELDGRSADGKLGVRFDTIRSIARRSRDGSLVTLADGREIALTGSPEVGEGNRGIYVDDPRYGRVLVSWDAFERVDFREPGASGSGPAYGDFPAGRPLSGGVTTRDGRHLAGRLVYDLDESVTTETLDAPWKGVHYTLPFDRVAAIVPPGRGRGGTPHARVTLRDGEELQLERAGDLGARNAGLLVFVDGEARPAYVPWTDVERVDLDGPPAR